MAEITTLALKPEFLGKEIFISREVRDVPAQSRFGQTTAGYREYAASSSVQPAFVIRVEKMKNAPKPTQRVQVRLLDPKLYYTTERNANRRALDIPIVLAAALEFADEKEKK
ncbi:MAG: hypothetical protein LBI13_01635 [Streptococcaceae bacterium]|jgi:hypothetical protein|nr:hypothetical protein [Streptococcaceae bacterium]